MDNLPNEIVLQILSYLNLGELIQCARVSKRLKMICKDKSLSYGSNMHAMKDLTVKDRKSIIDYLIARPEVREVTISWIYCPIAPCVRLEWLETRQCQKLLCIMIKRISTTVQSQTLS